MGDLTRPYALSVDFARRRCRLLRPLAGDQDRVFEIFAHERTAITGYDQPGRTRYLATTLLGAHNPRRSRLRGAHGLHAFQSGEAWFRGAPGGLAVFIIPALRGQRALSRGLARRQQCAAGDGRAAVKSKRRKALRFSALRCWEAALLSWHYWEKPKFKLIATTKAPKSFGGRLQSCYACSLFVLIDRAMYESPVLVVGSFRRVERQRSLDARSLSFLVVFQMFIEQSPVSYIRKVP